MTATTIHRALRNLESEEGAWVSITRLRAALPNADRDHMDKLLVRMNRDRRIILNPEMNQKALTEADWDAAVTVGDTPNHIVCINYI